MQNWQMNGSGQATEYGNLGQLYGQSAQNAQSAAQNAAPNHLHHGQVNALQ
jgi:hypothetical protein